MKTYPMFRVHVEAAAALRLIDEVFQSGFINEGVQVGQLTEALKPILGSDNLVLMNSCTSALTVAYFLAGVGPGTNVVTTPMTCIAGNTPIINLGGDIIWADVDPRSGMATAETIASKINDKTKAVSIVDWAGVPADLEPIDRLCRSRGIPLIQDAAHAFGARYAGRPLSDFADFTCYSFQAIKHFTCGDAGALICRDDSKFAAAKKMKWFGYDREKAKDERGNWRGQQAGADIFEGEVGFKYNLNNIAAAIGLANIPKAKGIVKAHQRNAALYDQILEGNTRLVPIQRPRGSEPSFWVYTTLLMDPAIDRDGLLAALTKEGIHAGVVHVPNDEYSAFHRYKADLPGVRSFSSRQLSLPCGWWLDESDIKFIADKVNVLTSSMAA